MIVATSTSPRGGDKNPSVTATLTRPGPRTRSAARTTRPAAGSIPALTGLRWIAALLVFLLHAGNLGFFGADVAPAVAGLLGAGSTGVSLFFVLSGFVLALSTRPHDRPSSFWRRRLARIYPLHVVTALTAVGLLVTGVPGPTAPSGLETAANLLLLSSWHHPWWQALNPVSWSLVCEVFFYACFPALMLLLRRLSPRGLGAVTVAMIVLVVALAAAAEVGALPFSLYDFPVARLPEFVTGVTCGLLVRLGRWRGPSLPAAAAAAVLGYVAVPVVPFHFQIAAATITGYALLIPAVAIRRPGTAVLAGPTAVRLGTWSFAFYLVHLQILWIVAAIAGQDPDGAVTAAPLSLLTALAVSTVAAGLLHRLVEQPGHHLITAPRRTSHRSADSYPAATFPMTGGDRS